MTVKKSKGSAIQITIGTTLTTVAQTTQFSFSGSEVGTISTATLDQAAAAVGYINNGFSEGGSVSGTCFFDPTNASQQALTDLITTPADDTDFNAIWESSATSADWAFVGIVTNFDPSANLNDAITADYGIKLDGLPTYQS